jgi:hypothetical protein
MNKKERGDLSRVENHIRVSLLSRYGKLARNKAVLMILFVIVPLYTIAQDGQSSHIQEVGINFNNLNSFGIRYKWGNDTTLFRITGLVLNGSYSKISPDSLGYGNSGAGFGFHIGFEKRKPIVNNLSFYDGLELQPSFNYSYTNYENGWKYKTFQINGGLGIVLGLSYKVSSNIYLDAELVPGIMYSYIIDNTIGNGITTTKRTSQFSFNLNNTASLTLSDRF